MPSADTFLAALGWSPVPKASPQETDADAAPAAVEPAKPRRRRGAPPVPPRPAPPHVVLHENRPVYSVPLVGELGAGKRFFVDLLTFDRMKLLAGEEWTLIQPSGAGTAAYVASRRQRAQKAAGEDHTAGTCVRLARWIMRAEAGQIVSYRNGDTLDLTARNLIVEDRGEFWEARRVPTGRRTGA